jgi:lipoprotein-anchoring transpeptidase ErfK/SrfK
MQFSRFVGTIGAAATLFASPVFASAIAQGGPQSSVIDLTRVRSTLDTIDDEKPEYSFESKADSLSWAKSKAVAEKASGFHIVVSLQDRHLWAIIGEDTVLSAPVAVAKGTTLKYGKQAWTFKTPRGIRTVLRKEADPIWQPPEWLYAETANEYGLKLGHLGSKSRIKLEGGGILTMKDGQAGVIQGGVFDTLPTDEHIVFGDTLYVPPLGSKNRKVEGELGKFRLDMGEGFLLHGTPYKDSIGMAATHGCVRMRDEDIEWLYDHIPVGTKVYIY